MVIIPLNVAGSPFTLRGEELYLKDDLIGHVRRIDADEAVGGYFRNDGRAATLNPNARSRCVGCAFCPNTLEAAADPRLVKMMRATVWRCRPVGRCQELAGGQAWHNRPSGGPWPGSVVGCIDPWGLSGKERGALGLFGGLDYVQACRELAISQLDVAALLRAVLVSPATSPSTSAGRSDRIAG
jgi:hypothetical protein